MWPPARRLTWAHSVFLRASVPVAVGHTRGEPCPSVSRRSSLRAGNQAFYPLSNKVLVLISLGGFHMVSRA